MRPKRLLFLRSCAGLLAGGLALLLLELGGQSLVRLQTGVWLFQRQMYPYRALFTPHPWLVVAPRAGAVWRHGEMVISHNALGLRGPDVARTTEPGQQRVLCYGGSTTYGVGVSDDATWPWYVGHALGSAVQVLNAGVPGYSTVEHVIQTALQPFDLQADACVYYLGWNDLRNAHVAGLKHDYSDMHAQAQVTNLGLDSLTFGNRSAVVQGVRRLLAWVFVPPPPPLATGTIAATVDERALAIYRFNVTTLIHLCRARGRAVLLIPQVLNTRALTGETPGWWVPFVRQRDIPALMAVYNQTLLDLCAERQVPCLASVLQTTWEAGDFLDQGHFSAQGNRKFAALVAQALQGGEEGLGTVLRRPQDGQ